MSILVLFLRHRSWAAEMGAVTHSLYHFRLDLEETASQRENSLLFPTKTCCLLQTKSNVCNLKKVFLSGKTCSNAALQLVDRLLLL